MKTRNRTLTYWVAFLLLTASFYTTGYAQDPEAELKNIMEEYDAVGLAVAVVKDGEIVYNRSLGRKNERNESLTDNDIFRIASISKSFTATAVMQLVEAGKVSLDDDVSDLIGFKVRNPNHPNQVITLKMLLSHTSSITDKQRYSKLDIIHPEKNPTWKNSYADYAPNTTFKYSNLNYNMAGTIVERVSGVRFDEYIKQNILDPLGLYGGYCVDSLDADRFVTLYRYQSKKEAFVPQKAAYASRSEELRNYTMGYDAFIFSPTGGMKISATDLAKYMMMHMGYGEYQGVRIISEESAKMMQQKIPKDENYGLGIRIFGKAIDGKVMRGHTGLAYGLRSVMYFHPEEKFGFVIMTNGRKKGQSSEELSSTPYTSILLNQQNKQ